MDPNEAIPYPIALRRLLWRWAVVFLVLIAVLSWTVWRLSRAAGQLGDTSVASASASGGAAPAAAPAVKRAWYRCTMPECGDVGSADPNSRCPVCGMKRESIGGDEDDTGDFEIKLGERAQRLATLETEPAARRHLYKHIRTVGLIGYDETRYKMVSSWIAGRIDRLFADFAGMEVNRGDHLVEIYSPELLSAQEEYLQAVQALESAGGGLELSRRSTERLVQSARRKLELLGVTAEQIEAVRTSGVPQTHLVVHAPLGGTIVGKPAMEGMYVRTGDPLYEIADLTHVWLLLDVYESDLAWVQPFQTVRVTAEALPGEQFEGHVAFVDPVLDPATRSVRVRVNVANPHRRLKPEMYVTAHIVAALSAGGKAAVPRLEAPFACPMHPWETSAEIAACPVCGMDTVPVESVPGYLPPDDPAELLAVARDAVMRTGQRSLVYVETEAGTYRGVEVEVGPLAQDHGGRAFYPVLSGLSGGEQVVVRGNFAIDSQMQLAGKPSLFNARGLGTPLDHSPGHQAGAPRPASPQKRAAAPVQEICPVMGNPVQPDVVIEYEGVKVYFCCWGCDKKFKADPEKYIPKLPVAVQQRIRAAQAGAQESDDD